MRYRYRNQVRYDTDIGIKFDTIPIYVKLFDTLSFGNISTKTRGCQGVKMEPSDSCLLVAPNKC